MYSHTKLVLVSGAVLQATPDLATYTDFSVANDLAFTHSTYWTQLWHLPEDYLKAILFAADAEDIEISGSGVIDGGDLYDPSGEEGFRGPMAISCIRVVGLQLHGYTVQASANWAHALISCQQVVISGVQVIGGHDGINLHHSQHLYINNCRFMCGDDCLAGYDVQDLDVGGCWFNTACNVTRLSGRHLTIHDCQVRGPGLWPHRSTQTYHTHALLKYYALAVDPNRDVDSDLTYTNMMIYGIERLVNYQYGVTALLQDGAPLTQLTLQGIIVSVIEQSSVIASHGQSLQVLIKDCIITPPANQPLLQIDAGVQLEIRHTIFTKPTVIEVAGRPINLTGTVNHFNSHEKHAI